MNVINLFLRFIAVVLLILVMLALPLSLLMRDLGALVFDPATTKRLIQDNLLDADFIAGVASQAVQGMLTGGPESDDPASVVVQKSLEQLDDSDWAELTELIAPPELLASTTDSVIDAFSDWLENDDALPDIRLDLRSWKSNIELNARQVVITVLAALPECTAEQIGEDFLEGMESEENGAGALPACLPPEPLYSTLLENADRMVAGMTERAPNEIDLDMIDVADIDQILLLKENLNRGRFILNWSWVLVLGLGALAVLMAARSIPQALKWSGWPLFLSGGLTLALGRGMSFFSQGLLERLLSSMFEEAPAMMSSVMGSAAGSILELVSRPLTIQGFVLGSVGLTFLISGNMLSRRPRGN